mmetsp:Transcript_14093/g.30554  ORF Transcript_14093/g.30554 Transcript_14093/m.30554 type:complete len:200 (+) Transcript_14093:129-728(+)|eukprot:CAMPEP_0202897144 /NCGR_PEP_ID=MMETSP1392-20130828/5986_1 /ASSEMBLY_ACC=CAM_ASM_000868 /TAXON_ID=225041 /ORGANISM="Chlamydomonas chlamydogama, Strain SAG 11-48b" /LENGTH=199 /DNA_ID=CAMNT_0049582715 /DNA_START=129 /DNA_END=728 /DNA_ORIENTATION=-
MLYGAAVWDPVLIIAQIISLQCLFYLTLGLFHAIFLGPYVSHLAAAHLLGWHVMSFHTYLGWMTLAANILTAASSAVYLMWLVERAKKCLDFASTCYIIHLVLCWSYSGFPASLEWWVVNGVGLLILSLLGEWLCVRREMAEIPLNALRARAAAGAAASGSGAPPASVQLSAASSNSVGGAASRTDSKARLLGDSKEVV